MLEDIQLNAVQVAAIIKVQFPDVSLSSVEHLGEGCEVTDAAPLEKWYAYFEKGCQPSTAGLASAVVHCDLAAEHVLYDLTTQELTGIIDWSEIAISDPSIDLAGFFHWGGQACIDAIRSEYVGTIDERVLDRARFLAACRGVGDVAFGLKTGRREYIEAGRRALDLCLGGLELPYTKT